MSVLNIQKFLPKIQNIFKALWPARLHEVAPVSISDEFPNPETGEFNLESPGPWLGQTELYQNKAPGGAQSSYSNKWQNFNSPRPPPRDPGPKQIISIGLAPVQLAAFKISRL